MQGKWKIQTAKNKFSEVINYAMMGKPQMITKNSKPAVYIISIEDYEAMAKKKDIINLLMNPPPTRIWKLSYKVKMIQEGKLVYELSY